MEIPAAGSHVTCTLLPRIKSIGSNLAKAFQSWLFCCNCVFATPKMYFCARITLNIHLCTLLPLDHQEKFLCIFGICGCSQPTSHCRALKTSPASFQPRFILFLNSGNAEQGDGLIKNQRIGSIYNFCFVKQDRFSCLGKLHSLHKWFSFAMRMKVWSLRSSLSLVSHQPD